MYNIYNGYKPIMVVIDLEQIVSVKHQLIT